MKLSAPLADILCTDCREPEEASADHLLYYETSVKAGEIGAPTVLLDVKQVNLQRVAEATFAASAVVAPKCPDCSQQHELRYYLQAIGVFVRGVQQCPRCRGDMELREKELAYEEDDNGPRIKLSGELYCPKCRSSLPTSAACSAPVFDDIASAGSVVVDLDVCKAETSPERPNTWRFEVALSFPGNHRDFVKQVADVLCEAIGKDRIFYDKHFEAELARPNLDTYLQYIYHNQSRLVAVFLCAEYSQRDWCHLEWRAVRDLIHRRSREVMLLRFDKVQPAGLFSSTDGYLDIETRTPQETAALVLHRFQRDLRNSS